MLPHDFWIQPPKLAPSETTERPLRRRRPSGRSRGKGWGAWAIPPGMVTMFSILRNTKLDEHLRSFGAWNYILMTFADILISNGPGSKFQALLGAHQTRWVLGTCQLRDIPKDVHILGTNRGNTGLFEMLWTPENTMRTHETFLGSDQFARWSFLNNVYSLKHEISWMVQSLKLHALWASGKAAERQLQAFKDRRKRCGEVGFVDARMVKSSKNRPSMTIQNLTRNWWCTPS
jgi:hypothetical protein